MSTIVNRIKELGVEPFDLRQPIYKYRSMESAIKIIESNQFYFPNAIELKDKLELHHSLLDYNFSQEDKNGYIQRLNKNYNTNFGEISDDKLLGALKYGMDNRRSQIGIFSASTVATHNSLWEHYAENQNGVCIGLKIPLNAFSNFLAFRVNYTDKPEKIKVIDLTMDNNSPDIFYWLCTKLKSYSYENEVRIINERGHGSIPFDKRMIFEVIFGAETKPNDYKIIADSLREHGYPIPKFGKVGYDNNIFGLTVDYFEI